MYKISLQAIVLIFILFNSCQNNHTRNIFANRIDRKALIYRHIPSLTEIDTLSPFSVGNGEFAFTVDITGLQTFPELYKKGIPLCTQSQWGWHSAYNPNHYRLSQTYKTYNTYGRPVAYACRQHCQAGQWLRANPHRLHLGKIGFIIKKSNGNEISQADITDIMQSADIWEGIIKSYFKVDHKEISVETACHPQHDQIAVRIKSELLETGSIGISFDFPYASLSWGKNPADWNHPQSHTSKIIDQNDHFVQIERTLDSCKYFVVIQWKGNGKLQQMNRHSFILAISAKDQFEFTCGFIKNKNTDRLPDSEETLQASKGHWRNFWETGGALDLSESKDPRAFELERRIVLSRYLTAIQCAGSLPPQETGLTFNSWYGKFHLEMHWWHGVHFVLWGHPELFEKSLSWYEFILPVAEKNARYQGYGGVRWPKMTAYNGRESPSTIGVFLIWQQPHPIYYAELLYRYYQDHATLEKYKKMVFITAEFMASYAQWDSTNKRYVLGPPLIPAQEIYEPDSTMNPAFELVYWCYGLKTAQKWRERLGLLPLEKWNKVINNLAKLPENDDLYQNAETALSTFQDSIHRHDHPALLAAYGMLPNDSIDITIMQNTLEKVIQLWDWETTWGWDFPLIAMTAARVSKPEIAVEALLMNVQKNSYLNNGHNYQNQMLPIYLPGNGALLTAVAMMAAGWEGAPDEHAPGFPKDGNWTVKYEGLHPLP